MKRIKVLAITRSPINSDDNLGSTIEKLLGNNSAIELHNLYLRSEKYNNDVCSSVYQISEQELIKSVFCRKPVGKKITIPEKQVHFNTKDMKEESTYNFIKSTRLYFPWLIREFIWTFGKWKNKDLIDYVKEINPDYIFFVSFNSWYPYRVLKYISRYLKSRIIVYHVDDNYSLNQLHISPFFWIHRFKLRSYIRSVSSSAYINFCISDMQKEAYDKYLNVNCKLLQKTAVFKTSSLITKFNSPINVVFTGNISSGRWKTLSLLAEAFDKINNSEKRIVLSIYTKTHLSKRIKKSLNYKSVVSLMPAFPSDIPNIQSGADILLHVESFDPKYIKEVKLSFSTKIVDYLSTQKPVLAVGPSCVASIQYFIKNDIGFYISSKEDICDGIEKIIDNFESVRIKTHSSYLKAKEMHDQSVVWSNLVGLLSNGI